MEVLDNLRKKRKLNQNSEFTDTGSCRQTHCRFQTYNIPTLKGKDFEIHCSIHIAVFTESKSQHSAAVLAAQKTHLPGYIVIQGKRDHNTGGTSILINEANVEDFSKTEIFTGAVESKAHGNIIILMLTPK